MEMLLKLTTQSFFVQLIVFGRTLGTFGGPSFSALAAEGYAACFAVLPCPSLLARAVVGHRTSVYAVTPVEAR